MSVAHPERGVFVLVFYYAPELARARWEILKQAVRLQIELQNLLVIHAVGGNFEKQVPGRLDVVAEGVQVNACRLKGLFEFEGYAERIVLFARCGEVHFGFFVGVENLHYMVHRRKRCFVRGRGDVFEKRQEFQFLRAFGGPREDGYVPVKIHVVPWGVQSDSLLPAVAFHPHLFPHEGFHGVFGLYPRAAGFRPSVAVVYAYLHPVFRGGIDRVLEIVEPFGGVKVERPPYRRRDVEYDRAAVAVFRHFLEVAPYALAGDVAVLPVPPCLHARHARGPFKVFKFDFALGQVGVVHSVFVEVGVGNFGPKSPRKRGGKAGAKKQNISYNHYTPPLKV